MRGASNVVSIVNVWKIPVADTLEKGIVHTGNGWPSLSSSSFFPTTIYWFSLLTIAYGQLHLIDTRKSVFYFLFKPIFLFSLVWDYFYSHYFYVSYERVLSFICFKLAVPSYFWESMSNFTALPDIVGVSFTCTWKCLTQLVMQGPSWLGFCILHKKSNQNSSTVFKKLDLDNDQHGDFCLCASSFSIKCKYSTLISGWHQPIKWCPQGAVQVAPSHTRFRKQR